MKEIVIRESGPEDTASIMALYPRAFPDEDLRPVVKALLEGSAAAISLIGVIRTALAGHVIFTFCGVDDGEKNAALLAPLAVDPSVQRQGVGGALVRHGLKALEGRGVVHVFVLGDPAYYNRFGFTPDRTIAPPYPMPPEWRDAWQSLRLNGASAPSRGNLILPSVWQDPALWRP